MTTSKKPSKYLSVAQIMSMTSSSSEEENATPNMVSTEPKASRGSFRCGLRAEKIVVAQPVAAGTRLRPTDIIKIFTPDNEYIEVTHEQIQRVRTMHKQIDEGVNFSFNFNVLLLVSSLLAAFGIVSDEGTTIIASMLVSPLMGPVVGLAYGTTICDWKLVTRSLRNELISLLFCIVIGLAVGGITGNTWLANEWPTSEMTSRTNVGNLIVALPVAFFSGLGVAVSLFDHQMASLVGVAISASLLPPAVNSGIVWIAHAFFPEDASVVMYGFVSLFLTLSNIILIWISSMLMFRMKEKLPIQKSVFWSDLGIARKLFRKKAIIQICQVNSDGTCTVLDPTAGDIMSAEESVATIGGVSSDEVIEIDVEA